MDMAENVQTKLALFHMEPRFVHQRWDDIRDYIAQAIAGSPWAEYTAAQLRPMLARGECFVLVARTVDGVTTGAIVVQISDSPNARIAHVMAIGGRGVNELWGDFKAWARANGCTRVRGWGTPAIARLWERLEMKEVCRVVELEL